MVGFATGLLIVDRHAQEDSPMNPAVSAIALATCLLATEAGASCRVKVGSLDAMAKAIHGLGPARRFCWPTARTQPPVRSASRETRHGRSPDHSPRGAPRPGSDSGLPAL